MRRFSHAVGVREKGPIKTCQVGAATFGRLLNGRCIAAGHPLVSRRLPDRMVDMQALKAKVVNGRLVLDEATTLPDGTEVDLTMRSRKSAAKTSRGLGRR